MSCAAPERMVFDTAMQIYSDRVLNLKSAALDPRYVYLEVQGPSTKAVLVLGFDDKAQANTENKAETNVETVQTWLSGTKDVLRTKGGWVVSVAGNLPGAWSRADWGFAQKQVVLDAPESGIYAAKMGLMPLTFDAQQYAKGSPMFQRAQQVEGLRVQAWATSPAVQASSSPALGNLMNLQQVVATDPSGNPVYGMHCYAPSTCIEYLWRTAQRNL